MPKDLNEQIKSKPYEFICEWMEEVLYKTGGRVWEIVSLMPVSLILPDFDYNGEEIRSNISCLLMGNPGSGKSTISKIFSEISYFPLVAGSITPSKLTSKIQTNPNFSLVVGDFSTMSRDPAILKIIESVIGEEKTLKKSTMNGEIDIDVNGVALLCGTNQDLSSYLTGGFIFRTVPFIIKHNPKEHTEIGKRIIEDIGVEKEDGKKKVVKNYYKDLLNIQLTKNHPKKVIGYSIEEKFKLEAHKCWDNLTKQINSNIKTNFLWFRELQEFFRFLVASAFLNVHNREVKEGILYPTKEDFDVAIKLMRQSIKLKYDILSMRTFMKGISDLRDFERIINSNTLSEERKEILTNLLNLKKGK